MPTQTAGINAAQIIEKAEQKRQSILGTIIKKVSNNPEKELVEREVEMMTESDTLAKIPYDEKIKESLFKNTPLLVYDPLAKSSLEISGLAADMEGQMYEKPKFAKLKRKLRNLKEAIQR